MNKKSGFGGILMTICSIVCVFVYCKNAWNSYYSESHRNITVEYRSGVTAEMAEKAAKLVSLSGHFGSKKNVHCELERAEGKLRFSLAGDADFFEKKKGTEEFKEILRSIHLVAHLVSTVNPHKEPVVLEVLDYDKMKKTLFRTKPVPYAGQVVMNHGDSIFYDDSFTEKEINEAIAKLAELKLVSSKGFQAKETMRLSRKDNQITLERMRLYQQELTEELQAAVRREFIPVHDAISGVVFPGKATTVTGVDFRFRPVAGLSITRPATKSVIREFKDGKVVLQVDQNISDEQAQQMLKRIFIDDKEDYRFLRLIKNGEQYDLYHALNSTGWVQDDATAAYIRGLGIEIFGELNSELPCSVHAVDVGLEQKWSVPVEQRIGRCYLSGRNRVYYYDHKLEDAKAVAKALTDNLKVMTKDSKKTFQLLRDKDDSDFTWVQCFIDPENVGRLEKKGLKLMGEALGYACFPNQRFGFQMVDYLEKPIEGYAWKYTPDDSDDTFIAESEPSGESAGTEEPGIPVEN